MRPQTRPDRRPEARLRPPAARAALLLLAAALAPVAVPAAESPAAPYWSVHVGSFDGGAEAFATLEALAGEPAARVEKRRSWHVRFGAWAGRGEAERALERVKAKFDGARVLQIENPVEWRVARPAAAASGQPAGATPVAPLPPAPATAVDPDAFKAAARRLDREVRGWLVAGGAARADGYVYGLDVAPLLLYAALRRDAALYEQLLVAARPLVVQGDDAATRGFVLWRHQAGAAPEVSGSAEALWLARALWSGHRLLRRGDDRALALAVLDGYARHAATESGTWLVHKYYAFGTGTFSGLSVLPAYHPDFLEEAEPHASDRVKGVARRSYRLLQRAVTPSRLLTPLIQPGIGALVPGFDVALYAPNGLVALEDSCAAVEGAQRGVPQLARNVLAFAAQPSRRNADGRLYAYYHRADGRPLGAAVLSSTGYACLARIATAHKQRGLLPDLKQALLGDMQALADAPRTQAAPLYAAGPLLLAADALGAL